MTSDAKIGLLLGLVFIFIIAFIINGLPSLKHNQEDTNELTRHLVNVQNEPVTIGSRERKVSEVFNNVGISDTDSTGIRQAQPSWALELPQTDPVIDETAARFSMPLPGNTTQTAPSQVISPAAAFNSEIVTAAQKVEASLSPVQVAQTNSAKTYTVQTGDTLATIAKKFYGTEEGNRIVNIQKIYKANSMIINSPEEIRVGQKLTIPPLEEKNSLLSTSLVEQVKSVGQRHTEQVKPEISKPATAAATYIVKENDNLWRIAASKLGDGNRYKEILKLNSGLLKNEDSLQVGMQLKLPAK